ncbi:MAG: rRNA maturation RNase YbeY [Cyclobacteriaceae bacterium]|nr:rRNA maturation RNase YbeY [Cyclobacteriaceae bacterium]
MGVNEAIQFFYEDTDSFSLTEPDKTKAWIANVIFNEGYSLTSINYIFCNDDYLHQINLEYLNHDTYTDVITFDGSEEEKSIEGEIYLSVERIRENALSNNTCFINELHRVMVHGVLHLIGFNDKTKEEEEEMRKQEEAYLELYPN